MVIAGIALPHVLCDLVLYYDTHASGGAGDHAHRALDVGGIQVGHLHLSDLSHLVLGNSRYLGLVRNAERLIMSAFFNNTAAGGVLVMKLKLLSAYTVITTGMITSPLSAVLALNSLVN